MPGLSVRLYECYVEGVSAIDRVIDAKSRNGTLFKGVSYLLPWISANGAGIDLVPTTGDQCLILASDRNVDNVLGPPSPNSAGGRLTVCIGFKIPVSASSQGLELGGRVPELPPGSMAIRTLSEDGNGGTLILTRGGSALIGANDQCRTLYSPIDSSIIHLFNNWKLIGPGGYVQWRREKGSDVVNYDAQYRVGTDSDSLAVNVHIGGDGDNPLDIVCGPPGGNPYLRVRVDANGEAHIEGESLNITGRAGVDIDGAQVRIKGRQVLGQGDPI